MAVKAGIIGYGYMGNFHIRKSNDAEDIEVIAVYNIHPEKCNDLQEKYPKNNFRVYSTLDDFLSDSEIELVFICTPNDSHKSLAISCLNAGKNVMCEKPVTLNCTELEEIIAVAEEKGKVFTVHQNRRWDKDFLTVKKVADSGAVGGITNIYSYVHGQRGVCFGWRALPEAGGGMLYDWGIHLIDQLLQLFPENKVLSVYGHLESILTPAVDDFFEIKMNFDNMVRATILVTTFCLQDRPRWFVYGDRGTLRLDDFSGEKGGMAKIKTHISGFDSVFGKTSLGPSRTMSPLQPEYIEKIELPKVESDPYEYHRNLAAACRGEESQHVTFEDMRRAMRIVDLAFESSAKDAVIKTII